MKSTYTVRLRKDGSILVPKALRALYGIKGGQTFNVEVNDSAITYHPSRIVCPVCGELFSSQNNLLTDQICPSCDAEAAALICSKKATTVSKAIKTLRLQKSYTGQSFNRTKAVIK